MNVAAQIARVLGRVMRQLLDLFDQTRDNEVPDDRDRHDQDDVRHQDDQGAGRPGPGGHRVDDGNQRKSQEQADRNQPNDDPDAPGEVKHQRARRQDEHTTDDGAD